MNAIFKLVSTHDLRRWSATRLQRLLRCPRQFAFAYVDQIPTIATIPLLLGGTLHKVVSDAHTSQMVGERFPTLEELKRDFENRFQLAVEEEQPFIRASDPKREEILVLAGAMLERFHLANSDVKAPKAVEHWFEIETEGVTLCGSIDRVDETTTGIVVADYKTGARRPSPKDAATDLQLSVYAFAARRLWKMPVERVEFHWLRDGSTIGSVREPGANDQLVSEVLRFATKTVERGDYMPRPGFYCRFCDFAALCDCAK